MADKVTSDSGLPNIEEVLSFVGEFGRFQKILVAVFIIICLPSTYQVLIMYFSTITPSWKCMPNSTLCTLNDTLLPDNNYRCLIPDTEWYYMESHKFSLVTQFDIHCGNEWKLHLVSSMIFVGWAIGGIALGWIGDRFGRRIVLIPSFCTVISVGFVRSFLPSVYLIALCQFVIGFCIPGVQLQAFILITEFVGSKQRPIATFLFLIFNPIGWCILAFKAYMIQSWKMLSIATTAPYLICVVFCKFIPESIKWLHLLGQTDKVTLILGRIARWNKKEFAGTMLISPPIIITDRTKTSLFDIFRTIEMTLKSLVQAFLWFSTVACYFGLHIAADDLGGTIYRDFALLNLFESPGIAIASFLCMRYGRKRTTLAPLLVGSVACLTIAVLQSMVTLRIAKVVIGIIGNIALTIAHFGIYQWSVELYPVRIRNMGMGFLQAVSRVGCAGVPWVVKGLKPFGKWCPFLVLGVCTLVAVMTSAWLPETNDVKVKDVRNENNNMELEKKGPTVFENQHSRNQNNEV